MNTTFAISESVSVDLESLIATRFLIQANSGGGKSYCLRTVLEQTHGKVQQLIIDPEGEFSTLREKFDYVHVARGQAVEPHPRTAKLLAEKLLELGVSAVLDIYELKASDRVLFVKAFLEALVEAPKRLWHPALVVVDEAHVFCPQTGEASSAGAVIDLCARGRKRGFCAVLATQRLSKLHKDAAAECNNRLIGRTTLDIDVRRAADELGLQKDAWDQLRRQEAGWFFAHGPAFHAYSGIVCRPLVGVRQVRIALPHTARVRGAAVSEPPPPSDTILGALAQLSALPQEQEQREKTVADLQEENAQLRRKLQQGPGRVESHQPLIDALARGKDFRDTLNELTDLGRRVMAAGTVLSERLDETLQLRAAVQKFTRQDSSPPQPYISQAQRRQPEAPPARVKAEVTTLTVGERAVLGAVYQTLSGATRRQISILTQYKTSTRNQYIQRLEKKGWVRDNGTRIEITPVGESVGNMFCVPLPTGPALLKHWLAQLPEGERRILECLTTETMMMSLSRDQISFLTKYKTSTRNQYIQRLQARELVQVLGSGELRAAPELFE